MTDLDKARRIINEVDQEMAHLFERRMDAVRLVAEYKEECGLPVEDSAREAEVLLHNLQYIENAEYQSYYTGVLRAIIEQSKRFQCDLRQNLTVTTSMGSYEILVRRGGLHRIGELFQLNRKVLIVSDSGVPEAYAMTVASQCDEAVLFLFEQGEASKCVDTYEGILQALVDNHFTRTDCIVAVGGGVVGDMAGFAAAVYLRGCVPFCLWIFLCGSC
jgi:monofunctional chorismate mutase